MTLKTPTASTRERPALRSRHLEYRHLPMPKTEGGDKDKMLNVAPANTKEPLRCLQTCPHVSTRGDQQGRVSPVFPCHQGCLGEGGDGNDFVCTWGELSSNTLISGCSEGSQNCSGDAAQTRGEAKGTAQLGREPQHETLGRDGSSHT